MSIERVIFRLTADVNGEHFEMNGEGSGSRSDGTCELHLQATPRFPEGFDPVSCPNICSHPTSSYFSRPLAEGLDLPALTGNAYAVQPARIGAIHDSTGRELLHLQVSGSVRVEDGVLISEHRMTGFSHLPELAKNLTPFDDYILGVGPGEATAVVRFKLLTKAGDVLDGMTIVPYRWDGLTRLTLPLVRRVEDINVVWNGGNAVSAYYRTSIRPVTFDDSLSRAASIEAGQPIVSSLQM